MLRDNTEFRQRFKDWKEGKLVYENGRPVNQHKSTLGLGGSMSPSTPSYEKDEGYVNYMKKLSSVMSYNWKIPQKDAYNEMMYNTPGYNYKDWYHSEGKYINPQDFLTGVPYKSNQGGHFPDTYKTPWHKTFSNLSKYSGKVSNVNPFGFVGGTWAGETFIPGPSGLSGYKDGKDTYDAGFLPEVLIRGEQLARLRQSDYLTASNDNTWVESRDPMVRATRQKNPHLTERSVQGAKAHAAWAEEHPILNAFGMALGAAPFAVAAAPAVTVAGDALAGSALGQGITSLLTNPYFDAAMTSLGGAHAVQSIANGEADAMTALELLPMTRVIIPVATAASKAVDVFTGTVAQRANEGMEMLSNGPLVNKIITPKVGWYGRAIIDGITNPIGTYKAVKNCQYIHDYSSLRRNMQSAYARLGEGIQFTKNEYKTLTEINVPKASVHIKPWKEFTFGTNGYYLGRSIFSPLTKNRFSNIRMSDRSLRNIGGHEQAHAANSWLNRTFGTPELGTYTRKVAKIIPNNYWIPNRDHPISDKYYRKFMLNPTSHGRYPEETWANYMGAKAAGMTDRQYQWDNFGKELMFPPKGFIEDYKTYLSDTYKPYAFFFE